MLEDPQSHNRWLQLFIKKIPLDGGTVIDKGLKGLAGKTFTQNVRAIGCDSHQRLKLFSLMCLICSKEYSIIIS